MHISTFGTTATLLLAAFLSPKEDAKQVHHLNGIWIPNASVNEVLGVPENKQWPYGFEILLVKEHQGEFVGSKEDLQELLLVAIEHQGSISARGTFAFLHADGSRSRVVDCLLSEKGGQTFLSVPLPYQAPLFTNVMYVQGAERRNDLVFFTWPPDDKPAVSIGERTTVGFSRKKPDVE